MVVAVKEIQILFNINMCKNKWNYFSRVCTFPLIEVYVRYELRKL